jgi:hypothetical protein
MSWSVCFIGHVMFGRGLYFDRGGGGGIFRAIFYLLGKIWGYVYLQKYHSLIIFVYLNYICGIVQVYLVIGLSFPCVVFVMSDRFCLMCVLSEVYVSHILSSLYWILNVCPVCQHIWVDIRCILIGILHFDYTCLLFPFLVLCGFILFVSVVLNAICMLVFLNNFVTVLILGP